MAKTSLIVLTTLFALSQSAPGATTDDARRPPTERRPYIIELGEPTSLSMHGVRNEASKISQLRTYLADYGYPDYAEIQEIEPNWPWESYEVRLYYLRRNLEVDFGHVFLSPAEPGFGVMRFQGLITPEKRHEIEVVLASRELPPLARSDAGGESAGITEALVARIEAAAERAAQAADRAVESSEAAKRAAQRTVDIVDQLIGQTQAQ